MCIRDRIENLSFQEIAYRVADAVFGEDVPAETLKHIVYDTLSFDVPAVKVKDLSLIHICQADEVRFATPR